MLDRTSAKTLHSQMEELMRDNLQTGVWAAGAVIPSEHELGNEYGVSRMTVRSVITKLVQEGLLFRIPGKGTFVEEQKQKIEATTLSYEGIRGQLEKMGYLVDTRLINVKTIKANKDVQAKLEIDPDEAVYMVSRLRAVKDKPLSLHTSYIPVKLAPKLEDLNLVDDQLCYILSTNYNLNRGHIIEELESVAANSEESKILEIPLGHPLLMLQDTIYDQNRVPFEYAKVVFRGDKIKLKLEF